MQLQYCALLKMISKVDSTTLSLLLIGFYCFCFFLNKKWGYCIDIILGYMTNSPFNSA